jgi:SSS family transporter
MNLSGPDAVVIILYLLLVLGVGGWFSRRMDGVGDYFLGGRRVPWPAICLSIVATETSALTFIGVPALAYAGDFSFLQLALGFFLSRIGVAFIFIRQYYAAGTYTVYGYLETRLHKADKKSAGLIFLVSQVLSASVRLYAAALVLSVLTGLSTGISVVVIGLLAVSYTMAGGIRAVIWTDVLQMIVLLLGGVLVLAVILHRLPLSFSETIEFARSAGKLQCFSFDLDLARPYNLWVGLIGGFFIGMASHGTDQALAQRVLTHANPKGGMKALAWAGFLVIPQFALFLFIGALLFVYYSLFPLTTELANPDQIVPLFVAHELPLGVAGLVIAGIFASAMSTLDSSLNAMASTTLIDFFRPRMVEEGGGSRLLTASRYLTGFWGLVLILLATAAEGRGLVLELGLQVTSYTYGGLLGLFLLGRFFPGTRLGPAAMVVGIATVCLAGLFTGLAWTWFVLLGALVTVATGLIGSALLAPKGK